MTLNNRELVELSFRNMVWFNQDELRQVLNGVKATKVFKTPCERKQLTKHGVLGTTHQHQGTVFYVTEKAIKLLENDSL